MSAAIVTMRLGRAALGFPLRTSFIYRHAGVRCLSASTETADATSVCEKVGISNLGITAPSTIHHNLSYKELFEHEQRNQEGTVMRCKYGETFAVDTGKFTGRSPKDKWIVQNVGSDSDANMWW